MRANNVKAKLDKTEKNFKCRLSDDIDDTIKQISECRKLAQKEHKARCNWARKVIYEELCKKMKFDHSTKCYVYKPESIQEK